MFETFEHTADMGLRVRAVELSQLFEEAAQALFSAIVEKLEAVEAKECLEVELQNEDIALLLFDWLKELLYRFDAEHRVYRKFQVEVKGTILHGKALGERLDLSRHTLLNEVKAITYHGLRVEQTQHGWLAEVIIDI
jgi:protein archease